MKDGQQIFIVVCRDRHVDLGLSVHLTLDGANDAIAEFQSAYADDRNPIRWVERTYGRDSKRRPWLRFVDSDHGDGPSAYIEQSEMSK